MSDLTKLVLVSGLSNSGKSSFADFLEGELGSTHVPLDKYFLSVPEQTTFLDWVQSPESIDWSLLEKHLNILTSGQECYTPAYDPWVSGQRLSEGGGDFHPRSRLMHPSEKFYVVAGCLAFEMPINSYQVTRIFIDVPLQIVASRHAGREVSDSEVDTIVINRLTDSYTRILEYRDRADFVFRGDATDRVRLEYSEILVGI